MRFFFTNKIIGLLLLPFRFVTIRFFKLDEIKIDFNADSTVIIDKGINKITWNVENVYLVSLSNLGYVNSSGELLIKNKDLPNKIKITVYGYKKRLTKIINFKKINFDWEKIVVPDLISKEIVFNAQKIIAIKTSYSTAPIKKVRLKIIKPITQIDTSEIETELRTIKQTQL